MKLVSEEEIRELVGAAFDEHRKAIVALLPCAQVEHIGATAVPGSLTKGDLDLVVRVRADKFEQAISSLRSTYAVHQPENWTPEFASLKAPPAAISVGVQLVVAGGTKDRLFTSWRDCLIADSDLLERYNAIKRRHAHSDPDGYRAAKADFISAEMAAR